VPANLKIKKGASTSVTSSTNGLGNTIDFKKLKSKLQNAKHLIIAKPKSSAVSSHENSIQSSIVKLPVKVKKQQSSSQTNYTGKVIKTLKVQKSTASLFGSRTNSISKEGATHKVQALNVIKLQNLSSLAMPNKLCNGEKDTIASGCNSQRSQSRQKPRAGSKKKLLTKSKSTAKMSAQIPSSENKADKTKIAKQASQVLSYKEWLKL